MSQDPDHHISLGEMYSDYFLDYASYVILERAVPHLYDGLKPVQRRILHSMKELDDGRYNKVANIVGNTMKYHPHGDQSIGDAMVQIGQKDLVIDCQGNWGNTLTGDGAAAPRYIEARLTPFALEVIFNPKTTKWLPSYDGRNKEPETLPVKFPLLLAQGVEGIAVGLACKILPHNFNELITAAVAYLRKEPFELVPDFPTGGIMDASEYRDGIRGGKIRVRARIEIEKKNILRITEIPFGTTTGGVMDSIVNAADKNKIKIQKIEDNTAAHADILVYLQSGADSEMMRDALYAFTDCEMSISPNSGVIVDGKPAFLGMTEILRRTTDQTKELLKIELEIRLGELGDKWHFSSLEKIFIENRIYRDIEESETWEAVLKAIDDGLKPFKKLLKREVSEEDLVRLTEIRIKRISKFNKFKADEEIKAIEDEIEQTEKNLRNLTRYTVRWYEQLGKKYGKNRQRLTEISSFAKVDRTMVAAATETLFLDAKNGFAGTSLKKEEALEKCSMLDDVIVFSADGKVKVTKVADKFFVGQRPLRVAVFRKDEDLIYSMIYRDGRDGNIMAKRFTIGGVTRDKEYDLTKGTKGSRVLYFKCHSTNEESSAQMLMVHMKSGLGLRNLVRPLHFAEFGIKGRSSQGNIVTKHPVEKILIAPKDFEP
ncbi:MAG: DNA gyrase/topoisomerase IV subunit A [Akkermansiaceae bacterium]|jgi:topoisomerase IV subunit A|nr:DNA gyrase/topoisomerase IV subunit A [Akkermansiaceae bacterium]MDP4647346.1 DNA gyrase/topoisomerase IV subunit A [Akkermansiaceae bacterium]MDP4720141.1 DNA gyrase/topoisomerase IV subunit A [Akkermansiaceae bacterium]MDP4779498.1 DNA gyrase/topoisomerase IV subunit A [Akkermansiaceae bacterium]MDP4847316.1 DNA gyrase/topoisomerase IV subunit A [Akkermansiaceae bacterium]